MDNKFVLFVPEEMTLSRTAPGSNLIFFTIVYIFPSIFFYKTRSTMLVSSLDNAYCTTYLLHMLPLSSLSLPFVSPFPPARYVPYTVCAICTQFLKYTMQLYIIRFFILIYTAWFVSDRH